jgi:MFS family permease
MIFAKLTTDGFILFFSRILRMFGYGFLSVVLVLYLSKLRLNEFLIGFLLSATLIGDATISLWMTTSADRAGRRRILAAGAGLMLFASLLFAGTDKVPLLLIAATIGVISPSGYEVGPFLSVEQAALSEIVSGETRTEVFAWYNLVGSFATAAGALAGGALTQILQQLGLLPLESYRTVVVLYGLIGILMGLLFTRLSAAVEAAHLDTPPGRRHSACIALPILC